ncbi:hypothetical protein MSPGM_43940 [Methylorubrum sp. GM97]|nr:hypothetical protein MSPGM_43940 [Methylorubrum sp. GM97]
MRVVLRSLAVLAIGSSSALAQTTPQTPVPAAPGQTGPAAPPPAQAAQAPVCNNACIRGNADRAVQACAPRVEAQAPGDYDWLMRPYGSIFQEADSPEQPTSPVVRYRGDSIRILSPQREWVRAIYECGYDTAKQEVAYVNVRVGVLGKASAVPVLPTPAPQARARQTVPAQPASPAQPTAGQAQAASPAQPVAPTSDRRRVGEMDEVSVLQIKPSSKAR